MTIAQRLRELDVPPNVREALDEIAREIEHKEKPERPHCPLCVLKKTPLVMLEPSRFLVAHSIGGKVEGFGVELMRCPDCGFLALPKEEQS